MAETTEELGRRERFERGYLTHRDQRATAGWREVSPVFVVFKVLLAVF